MTSNQTTASRKPEGATCVALWDDVEQDRWGDEVRAWFVAFCDDNGDPVGQILRCDDEGLARRYAARQADLYNLDFECYA